MSRFFLTVVNMSISASWIVIAVLLLRMLLIKAPRWMNVLLWGIVAVRLICPFSVESILSLIPSSETVSTEIMMSKDPCIDSGVELINNVLNPVISNSFTPMPEESANPLQIWIPVAAAVWLFAVAVFLLYMAISCICIKKKVSTAFLYGENIYQSEYVSSPFVLGIIKPRIYLPFHIKEQDIEYVISHEQAHIARFDHIWKPIGFLLLSIHWFNPLMWLGYILFCRDIELACDERVIKELNNVGRVDYSQALLNCSAGRRTVSACPLAFGEVGVRSRVKKVLNYKKPALGFVIIAVIALVAASVCLLTDPKARDINDLNDDLHAFLDAEVEEFYGSKDLDGNFSAVSYDVMEINEHDSETSVYAWVLYREYIFENGKMNVDTESHIPTVITVEKNGNDHLLKDFWMPRDGNLWSKDVKNKFPVYLWTRALNGQSNIAKQSAECDDMAEEYFKSLLRDDIQSFENE